MKSEERIFSRKELRNAIAREIREIRARQFLYLQASRDMLNTHWRETYERSASACSASIGGVRSLAKRLGLDKKKEREGIWL